MNAPLKYSVRMLLGLLLSLSLVACGGESSAENVSLVKCRLNSDCPDPDLYKCIEGECILKEEGGDRETPDAGSHESLDAGSQETPDAGSHDDAPDSGEEDTPIVGCNPGCDNGYECDTEAHRCICTNSRIECNVGGVMKCVDMYENENHCGECNNKCADRGDGLVCKSGQCVCPNEGEGVCPNGSCISIVDDQQNCGACQNVCGIGKECKGESCVCRTDAPTDCGDYCTNTADDMDNCGECGLMCPWSQECVDGKCICPDNLSFCPNDKSCVNFQNDKDNCGGCGIQCRNDQVCQSGKCQCPSGKGECNGECIVFNTNDHCGSCSNSCSSSQRCNSNRTCECDASRDYIQCSGTCVKKTTDFYNCGRCGNQCKQGGYCSSDNGGTCKDNCASGQNRCKGICINYATYHIESCNDSGITACAVESASNGMYPHEWADVDQNVSNGCEENVVYKYMFTLPSDPTNYNNSACDEDRAAKILKLNTGATYTISTDSTNKRFVIKDCSNNAIGYITPNPQSTSHWQQTGFRFVQGDGSTCSSVSYNSSSRTFRFLSDNTYCYLQPYNTYYNGALSGSCKWKMDAKSTKVSGLTITLDPNVHPTGTSTTNSLSIQGTGTNKYMFINTAWTGTQAKFKLNYTASVSNGANICAQPTFTWTSDKSGYVTVLSDGRINLINRTVKTVVQAKLKVTTNGDDDEIVVDIAPFPLAKLSSSINSNYQYASQNEVSSRAFMDFLNARGIGCNGKYNGNDLVDTGSYLKCSDDEWGTGMGGHKFPVTNICWYGADEYAKWIGGKLPSELEWREMACGVNNGGTCHYPGNYATEIGRYGWTSISGQYTGSKPSEVQRSAQKTPVHGYYDIIGNLWEFVIPSTGNDGWRKGCGFRTTDSDYCDIQYTDRGYSKSRILNDNGFRVLLKEQH